jgi:hypothetical protein
MLDRAKRCVFIRRKIRTVIRYHSESEPHPHLVIEEIVPAGVYERLRPERVREGRSRLQWSGARRVASVARPPAVTRRAAS